MGSLVFTHPVRIFRQKMTQKHDMSLLRSAVDIYGEDKWCRIEPDEANVIPMPDQSGSLGMSSTLASVYLENGVDVQVGYVCQIKEPRVIDGNREAVVCKISSVTSVDDTSISLNRTDGLEVGQLVTISDGTNRQYSVIKSVDSTGITVYDEDAMDYAFAVGTDVTVSKYYKVWSVISPMGGGPWIEAKAQQITRQDYG